MVSESFNNQEYPLRLLYENPLPMVIFDTGGGIVDFNRAFIDFSGYGDESVGGMHVSEFKTVNHGGEGFSACLEKRYGVRSFEDMELPSGLKYADVRFSPVKDGKGDIEYVFGVYIDKSKIISRNK